MTKQNPFEQGVQNVKTASLRGATKKTSARMAVKVVEKFAEAGLFIEKSSEKE